MILEVTIAFVAGWLFGIFLLRWTILRDYELVPKKRKESPK